MDAADIVRSAQDIFPARRPAWHRGPLAGLLLWLAGVALAASLFRPWRDAFCVSQTSPISRLIVSIAMKQISGAKLPNPFCP